MKTYHNSIFIFRRDLRLFDNTALHKACQQSQVVNLLFIFDPRQIESHPYQSQFGLQFLKDSLSDLNQAVCQIGGKLNFIYGKPDQVLSNLIEKYQIEAVFVNQDYTPFSNFRDQQIEAVCQNKQIDFHVDHDLMLQPPKAVTKKNGSYYTIFTPYYNCASQLPVNCLQTNTDLNKINHQYLEEHQNYLAKITGANSYIKGGRIEALKILTEVSQYELYQNKRDFPSLDSTTKLSAHHKFGTISIRETYYQLVNNLGKDHALVRQLYWRDFFMQISDNYPYVYGKSFQTKYQKLNWENDLQKFQAWRDGQTGFPIVDAGMKELNQTGYMHNRVRMIVASFLTKDLHIDWRWGERYFAQKLIDYDPAVNNGSWQWSASTGCDSQPYFRIFNPWLQQQKFDAEAIYIKKWLPELQNISAKQIHKIKDFPLPNYPKPIVDHAVESEIAKQMFKERLKK